MVELTSLAVRLLRAGRTSGIVLGTSDLVAQSVETAAFNERGLDLRRTFRWLLIGLTLDGPFWHSGFQAVDRLFAGRGESWSTLLGKTAVTQLGLNPPFILLLILYTQLLDGPRSVAACMAAVRAKLCSYIRDGFCFWTAANSVNYLLMPPHRRLLFSGVVGMLWSTHLSFLTKRLDVQRAAATTGGGEPEAEPESQPQPAPRSSTAAMATPTCSTARSAAAASVEAAAVEQLRRCLVVYYINLDSRTDRCEQMEITLRRYGERRPGRPGDQAPLLFPLALPAVVLLAPSWLHGRLT
jgi:hypothetical protein